MKIHAPREESFLILHIIIGLDVGGAELMLQRLVESHDNEKFRHAVVSLSRLGKIGSQLQASGIEVYALGMHSAFDIPRVLWSLVKLVRKLRPTIVQTWMYHADLLGGLAARLAGVRHVIWCVRNTDVRAGAGVSASTGWVMRICAFLSYSIPNEIVYVAHSARFSHKEAGYTASKFSVVPNGFDLRIFDTVQLTKEAARLAIGLPIDGIFIGSIGRFNAYKDHFNFICAASKIASKHSNVKFLVVGRDISTKNSLLMRWIKEAGLEDRFFLLGERSDVPECLAAMDIFCLHSLSEGFPNVVGEAMCSRLPCVVTDVGDAALLVGNAGIVVPPKDPDALAQALSKLVSSTQEFRASLGHKARQRIEERYSLSTVLHQYEMLYQEVLSK